MATNFGLSSDSEDSDEDMRVIIGQRQICNNRPWEGEELCMGVEGEEDVVVMQLGG